MLRAEGLSHIQSLSHSLWTDYNAHDPGITTLEALCYAITELGYRSGFDMQDRFFGSSKRLSSRRSHRTPCKAVLYALVDS